MTADTRRQIRPGLAGGSRNRCTLCGFEAMSKGAFVRRDGVWVCQSRSSCQTRQEGSDG